MSTINHAVWKGLCLLPLWFLATGHAQAQTVDRPAIKVGDRWKYEQRDSYTNQVTGQREIIITAVSEARIEATDNGGKAIYSPDMNPEETPESRFEPTAAALRFPFSKGDKWSWNGKVHLKATGMMLTNQYEMTVNGQESVTVKAGSFDTYKLVMQGYINTDRSSRPFTRTYWYAPSARGFVRIVNEDRASPWQMELQELALTQ
ncbi:MAG: hypothetical protein F9K30_15640 [Dechloromonas sp.]|nr:MAG: hypothetical protein F9K30_15640 [Dechloromonas sp.]